MTLNYDIPPSGPTDAQIILIGEAPSHEEYRKGKPFVGSAGKHLDRLLTNAGLHRGSLYLTNVSKEKAPGNKMANMPFNRLQLWKADLIEEINTLPNPKILVPLGNYALEAVTGRSGITNLRGSVLHPTSRIKHDCLVIPTFHPSKLHYDYTSWPLIVADFMRVKKLADSGFNFEFPTYSFILKPTFDQVMATLEKLEKMGDTLMTIDVETPHRLLSCFSIAWSRSEAICIPFFLGTGRDYWTVAEETAIWRCLAEVLPKLNLTNQNVLFDWSILLQHGIRLKIPKFDSMLMHSCLYSELPHRLEIITSIYTDVEFYKRDEKEEKGSSLKAGQEMAHWRYCCYDSVAALWSIEELLKELVEENMLEPYLNLFADLIEPIFLMNITGIKADLEKLKIVRKDLGKNIKNIDAEIERAVGHELNVKSPKQVAKVLFDNLHMVGYKSRQTGKVTTSEKDLIKLAHKYQIDLPLLIVKNRKDYKLLSLFAEENIDDDGRIRCQYSLTRTKTGRIASKKSFSGRGMNLQNVKREGPARSFFVPEKGHIMIGADQKNAEAQMMAWLSRDEKMLALFESGKSIHIENAKNLFGKVIEKSDPLYTIGKGLLFGCVLEDHEILTKKGWQSFKNFEMFPSEIAQWDNGKITFVTPEFVKYSYNGKMYHFDGIALDLAATPDHRMVYVGGSGKLDCAPITILPRTARIPTTGIYQGIDVSFDDEHALLAVAVQADGHVKARMVHFRLVNEKKIERLKSILLKLRIPFKKIPDNYHKKGFFISFSLDDTTLESFLTLEYNQNYTATKYFKVDLFDLPLRLRQKIIEEMPFWDGHISKDHRNRRSYKTTNFHNAQWAQTVAHISGIQAILRYKDRVGKRRLYIISFNNRHLARISHCAETSFNHIGFVYCVKVPSSFFLIRRNCKIYVSGNSNYGIGPWAFARNANLPYPEAKLKLALYYSTYPNIKDVFWKYVEEQLKESRTLYNPFGRRQIFFDRLNEATLRAGYAFIPQSTVTDINKIALKRIYKQYLPVLEVHDGLIISVPKNEIKKGIQALRDAYNVEFEVWNEKHVIPVEVSIGSNWHDMKEIN